MSTASVSVQGPAVRLVFERYDSGLYSPEKVVSTLQGLGIKTPQNFVDLVHQYSRSRNLPYRDFLKALSTETPEFKAGGLSAETIRQFNLRSAPVAAAAKAPFDTITDFSEAQTGGCPRQRRYLPPTAHLESAEVEQPVAKENSRASDAVFGRTVDVFSGEEAGQHSAPTPREVDERKLKLMAGHGDIITWQEDHVVDVPLCARQPAISVSDRRIADVQGDKSLLVWAPETPSAPKQQPESARSNILAFDENFERNKVPASALDVKMSYPFATEADDLAAARARYHKQRIHKMTASTTQQL